MVRLTFQFAVVTLLAVNTPTRVAAQAVDGVWKLTYLSGVTVHDELLVKLTTVDGKVTAELLDGFNAQDRDGATVDGRVLKFNWGRRAGRSRRFYPRSQPNVFCVRCRRICIRGPRG